MAFVTVHARQRYVERIAPTMTQDEASACIMRSAAVIDTAAAFGCRRIQRADCALLLEGDVVVTVAHRRGKRGYAR